MKEISRQEYVEFFKWLFGENIEIKEEFDISMALDYEDPNIYYTKEIYDLFQTKSMRRLGRITHLGAFILVDKNLYHTRLEHSKGAYRRCTEFLATQYRNPKWREYIEQNKQKGYLVDTIKFMCTHDIGHSMLSHSIEKLIGDKGCTHEDIGNKIRNEDEELKAALDRIKPNEEKSNKGDGSLDSLCEGNIDFDRFDYLSRDYLYLGEEDKNINYIIGKLDSLCKLEKLENGKMVYVYECEAMQYIESFLLFREDLYKKHYRGKDETNLEHYLRQIVKRVMESKDSSDLKNLFVGLYNKNIDDIQLGDILQTDDLKLFNSLIRYEEESQDEILKALIKSIIPNSENAFALAVNIIDPKNRDIDEYTEDEKDFINNVRKIITKEIETETDLSSHIMVFESDNDEVLYKLEDNSAIEYYKKKFRIYKPDEPIYVKDKDGQIIRFEEHPDLSINLDNEYRYGVFVLIDELKRQGKTQKEIDCIIETFTKYDDKTLSDKQSNTMNILKTESGINKSFENFFADR